MRSFARGSQKSCSNIYKNKNVYLSGGDANRLGIRFVVKERVATSLFHSLFLADIFFMGRSYDGLLKIYMIKGWEIIAIQDESSWKAFVYAVSRRLVTDYPTGLQYASRLLVLLVSQITLIISVILLVSGLLRDHAILNYIEITYAIKGFFRICLLLILRHIARII